MRYSMHVSRSILVPLISLLVVACTSGGARTGDLRLAPNGAAEYNFHSDRVELNTPAAMCTASFVEVATVRALGPSRWNTVDGVAPLGDLDKAVYQLGYLIYTPVVASDAKSLTDHRVTATKQFVAHGGEVGGIRMKDDAYPQFAPGDRYVIVFVPTLRGGVDGFDSSILVAHNAFLVSPTGQVVLQPQLVEQGHVTQPEITMSLADLTASLSHC